MKNAQKKFYEPKQKPRQDFKKAFEISIAVKTKFQGIGIAKKLLQESIKILNCKVNKGYQIISIVKKINQKSIKFFEKYGFILIDQSKEFFYYSLKIQINTSNLSFSILDLNSLTFY